jgi:hypothetical protein
MRNILKAALHALGGGMNLIKESAGGAQTEQFDLCLLFKE